MSKFYIARLNPNKPHLAFSNISLGIFEKDRAPGRERERELTPGHLVFISSWKHERCSATITASGNRGEGTEMSVAMELP